MDYVTECFTPSRLVPNRELRLPVTVNSQSKENVKFTPPKIYDGVLYKIRPRICIDAYSESDLSLLSSNNEEEYVKGIFGLGSHGLFVEIKGGITSELSLSKLERMGELDLGIIPTPRTLVFDDYFIVMLKEEISPGFPLQVGRLDIGKNTITWRFTPEHSLKSFAINDNGKHLVVTDARGGISCLDIATGETQWQKNADNLGVLTDKELSYAPAGRSTSDNPHIFGDIIILGYAQGNLVGIDIHTGNVRWKRKINADIRNTTVDNLGRQYYLAAFYATPTLIVVDGKTGDLISENEVDLPPEIEKKKFSSSAFSDLTKTHFWGVSPMGILYAINLETSKMDWYLDLEGQVIDSAFFICNNRLYISTFTAEFVIEGLGGYIPG